MINKIKSWFKPVIFKNLEHKVDKVFTHNGKDYYSFADSFNVPYERALTALTYYEEFRMRCSRDFLLKHVEAVDALINAKTIKLTEIAKLNAQLKERTEWILEPDLLYKLASVLIFDSTESPYTYDFEYNKKKIEGWKKDKELLAFFLRMPIMNVIPFLKDLEMNLEAYSEMIQQATKIHLESISTSTSESLN